MFCVFVTVVQDYCSKPVKGNAVISSTIASGVFCQFAGREKSYVITAL